MSADLPIGVFDSGVGGLTVLRAIRERLPNESLMYLGDTARLPYGTKSPETVTRYALQATRILVERGIKMLVVACNTASAVALDALRAQYPGTPVVGVVEPGAQAACDATRTGRVVVIGTEGTIRGGAYERAIRGRRPDVRVTGIACPLFVGLAEEGWTRGEVPQAVARAYLGEVLAPDAGDRPDCLVLGCTHFPVLVDVLASLAGPSVTLVDSAATTAAVVAEQVAGAMAASGGELQLLATDATHRFARVGSGFLGHPLDPAGVELVDLHGSPT